MHLMQPLRTIGLSLTALLLTSIPALAQYNGQYAQQPQQAQGAPAQPVYSGPPQGSMPQPAPNGMATGMMTHPPQGVPYGAQPGMQQAAMQQPGMAPPSSGWTINQWFQRYDQIRRDAQMSPTERQQADSLMSRGLSILVPGENKLATKQLLANMVGRYQRACLQLKEMPQIPPTQQLHISYYNYFNTAGGLFGDYLRVQDNLFLTDATTGQPVAAGLIQRKQMLEALEGRCKQLDGATRQQFGVPPYQY